jgi:subtilisin family serine protease
MSRHVAVVAAISALVAAASVEASAQRIGNVGGGMVRSMAVPPRINMGVAPGRVIDGGGWSSDRYRGFKVGTTGGKPPRDPGRPPRNPGRGDGPRGPGFGPIIGTAVIGVATAVGTAAAAPPPPGLTARGPQRPRGGINIPPSNENRFVANEVMLEFVGNLPASAINALAARHRLQQIEAFTYSLTNTTWFRARIADRRDVRTVLRGLGREASLRAAQPNYLYALGQAGGSPLGNVAPVGTASNAETIQPPATPAAAAAGAIPAQLGDPAQYVLTKLRVGEAHGFARGSNVLVAVIDSQIDLNHPELNGVIAGSYDALGAADQKPHVHGTGIAGSIAAHSRLMGVAPAARILAIRAFSPTQSSAEATSAAIIKSVEYAAINGARVINMSFAGPADPGLARHLTMARARGAVLIAAAGNFGAKSPPQYPAADANVIAVSASDENDRIFTASNRGAHIAVTAPGVDILMPAPDANYQVKSGTSFSAAHVAGIAALILEKKPQLSPESVRQIIISSARDIGAPGKDPDFGAGLADAYQAILALETRTSGPVSPVRATGR